LVGWMINLYAWRMMFAFVGIMTLGMMVLFVVVIRDHPHEHPWLANAEKARFREAFGQERTAGDAHGGSPITLTFQQRLATLARIRAFWLMCIAAFFGIGVYFTSMSWLPGYLVKERGYTVLNSGFSLTIPYLAAFAGMFVAGGLGDRFGNRSLIALIAGLLTFPALMGMAQSQTVIVTIAMMSATLFLNSASLNGVVVLVFDTIPAEVFGTSIGIIGGLCGGIGGVLGPLLLGYLYDQTGTFFWGFVALGLGATLGALALIPVIGDERRMKQEKVNKQTTAAPSAITVEPAASS
jgi:sugar phosphate permease